MSDSKDQKVPNPAFPNSPLSGIQKPTPTQGVETNSYNPPSTHAEHYAGGKNEHEKK